jgi:hypothetical protein
VGHYENVADLPVVLNQDSEEDDAEKEEVRSRTVEAVIETAHAQKQKADRRNDKESKRLKNSGEKRKYCY